MRVASTFTKAGEEDAERSKVSLPSTATSRPARTEAVCSFVTTFTALPVLSTKVKVVDGLPVREVKDRTSTTLPLSLTRRSSKRAGCFRTSAIVV